MRCFLAVLAAVLLASPAAALSIGQADSFEDGTTQGWLVGLLGATHPAPPLNVASGGPAGADDNYLLLTAVGGQGPGSRLAAANLGQWAGNYAASGITSIGLDLRNLGSTDLSIRLLLSDPVTGPAVDVAMSGAVLLPSGGGWTHVEIAIDAASLTLLQGDLATLLANTTELRIFHAVAASFPPDAVVGQLGVDNVTALPEPALAWLAPLAAAALAAVRRR